MNEYMKVTYVVESKREISIGEFERELKSEKRLLSTIQIMAVLGIILCFIVGKYISNIFESLSLISESVLYACFGFYIGMLIWNILVVIVYKYVKCVPKQERFFIMRFAREYKDIID